MSLTCSVFDYSCSLLFQLFLVLAICETCPASEDDIIIPVLLNLFDTRSSLLDLLKLLIEREVKSTRESPPYKHSIAPH